MFWESPSAATSAISLSRAGVVRSVPRSRSLSGVTVDAKHTTPSSRVRTHVPPGAEVTSTASATPGTHAARVAGSRPPSSPGEAFDPQHQRRPSGIRTQACVWPTVTAAELAGKSIGVGATWSCRPRATPTMECSFDPQHTTCPERRRAQALNTPAATSTASSMPAIKSGSELNWVLPLPSCPWLFRPQQAMRPRSVTAQEKSTPAAMCRTSLIPPTRTGSVRDWRVPSPSCPVSLLPQHTTRRSARTKHAWVFPADKRRPSFEAMTRAPASIESDEDGDTATIGTEPDRAPAVDGDDGRSRHADMDPSRATMARLGGRTTLRVSRLWSVSNGNHRTCTVASLTHHASRLVHLSRSWVPPHGAPKSLAEGASSARRAIATGTAWPGRSSTPTAAHSS